MTQTDENSEQQETSERQETLKTAGTDQSGQEGSTEPARPKGFFEELRSAVREARQEVVAMTRGEEPVLPPRADEESASPLGRAPDAKPRPPRPKKPGIWSLGQWQLRSKTSAARPASVVAQSGTALSGTALSEDEERTESTPGAPRHAAVQHAEKHAAGPGAAEPKFEAGFQQAPEIPPQEGLAEKKPFWRWPSRIRRAGGEHKAADAAAPEQEMPAQENAAGPTGYAGEELQFSHVGMHLEPSSPPEGEEQFQDPAFLVYEEAAMRVEEIWQVPQVLTGLEAGREVGEQDRIDWWAAREEARGKRMERRPSEVEQALFNLLYRTVSQGAAITYIDAEGQETRLVCLPEAAFEQIAASLEKISCEELLFAKLLEDREIARLLDPNRRRAGRHG